MVPRSIVRIVSTAAALVAGVIIAVLQDACSFSVETTRTVAREHGVWTPAMLDHLSQMGCFACVCVCVGVLGRKIVLGTCRLLWCLVYHTAYMYICIRILYTTVRFWCQPLERCVVMLLSATRRVLARLPVV